MNEANAAHGMRFDLRILITWEIFGVVLASAGISSVKRWEITGRASKRHRLDVGVPAYYF
jgi:hypothetical protein